MDPAAAPARTTASCTIDRKLPVGAEPTPDGVHFRVRAPKRRSVEVVLETSHAETLVLYHDLVRLRREGGDDHLVLVNLGRDLHLYPTSEPLLALLEGRAWQLLWSSEEPRYGGGTPTPEDDSGWRLPRQAALVAVPRPLAGGA